MLDTSELLSAVGGDKAGMQPDEKVVERLRFDDALKVPLELTDLDLWSNYVDDDLYEMDKKVREFLKGTRYARLHKGGYRTTASVVFAWIFGRQPEPNDGAVCRTLHELLKYYCTSYTGATTYQGKKVNRVYEFSKYSVSKKRPYSLRLRLEESADGDKVWRNGPGYRNDKKRHGRRKHSENGVDANV